MPEGPITAPEVRAIFATTNDVSAPIALADLVVTENLAGKGLTAARLRLISLYLAVYYAALFDLERGTTVVMKREGQMTVAYARSNLTGLAASPFGEMALMLDTSGTLAGLLSGLKKASLESL